MVPGEPAQSKPLGHHEGLRAMLTIRVFLSSPGDVAEERRIAVETLRALEDSPLLRERVNLLVVAWDDPVAAAPLDARETPQASVNRWAGRPADCDLTIVILWSRLGTPLPPALTRVDGSRFASGTVWEVEDAVAADRPVFIYRRTDKPRIELDDAGFDAKRAQYDAVRSWFDTLRDADGAWRSGVNEYAGTAQFQQLLRAHLEAFIGRLLAQGAPASSPRDTARDTTPVAPRVEASTATRPPAASAPTSPGGSRRWRVPATVGALLVAGVAFWVWRGPQVAPAGPAAVPATASTSRAADQTPAPAPAPAVASALPKVTLGAPAEVVFTKPGGSTYTVLAVTTEPRVPGVYGLRFRLRMAVPASERGGAGFWDANFRLLIDGVPRAADSALNEVVAGGSAKDADLSFEVPDGTQALALRIVHHDGHNVTADLPLVLQGAGPPRPRPALPAGPRTVALDGPRELVFTKAGNVTYTVLDIGTEARAPGTFGLRIRMRMYAQSGGGGANFWDDSFRLLVDGVPLAPTSGLNLVVGNRAALDADITFDVPSAAKTLALRVIHHAGYGIQADLPLKLGAAP
jgi:hypothetical protein